MSNISTTLSSIDMAKVSLALSRHAKGLPLATSSEAKKEDNREAYAYCNRAHNKGTSPFFEAFVSGRPAVGSSYGIQEEDEREWSARQIFA